MKLGVAEQLSLCGTGQLMGLMSPTLKALQAKARSKISLLMDESVGSMEGRMDPNTDSVAG